MKEIEIHGLIKTEKTTEELAEDFINWIESRNEQFNGSWAEWAGEECQLQIVDKRKLDSSVHLVDKEDKKSDT